ncbi:hypothetical protein [Lapidilactobacillus luobeiensis]|uniref:hypothetical protein n=1 Tax=Lapidilactobacillus luobeiensis TaxID=2950371 RepID=UPI0021C45E13|nr:hypothetical protein [Lapidilactobacillus luobeiensis]
MDYLENVTKLAQRYAAVLSIQLQLAEIQRCCQELEKGRLLSRPLPPLQLTDDDWWQMVASAEGSGRDSVACQRDFLTLDHLLHNFRKYLQYHFGQWTLISEQALAIWTHLLPGRRYLELMAGNGRLARSLAGLGQSVIATDSFAWRTENKTGRQTYYPVEALAAPAALHKYATQVDIVVLSWSPNNDPLDWLLFQQLQQLPASQRPDLLVIGEPFGVTNSLTFWQFARRRFSAPAQLISRYLPMTSDGVHEQVLLF